MLIIRIFISALAALCLLLPLSPGASAQTTPCPSAQSAIVMTSNGRTLYEKNADSRALIASTTKLMTAIVTLENARLNELVDITEECCNIEGSSMYLKAGERYTVKELLLGLLLVSGNDAAQALALHVAGSPEAFAGLMNAKAKELGMEDSHFENPHGLDAQSHYSTARDMAKLMCYCMENESFRELCSTRSCLIKGLTLVNHNKLLDMYPDCIGGKTGYTQAAGRCLVSCCERKGLRLICVTLSAPDDWNDHIELYEWAFSQFSLRNAVEGQSFQVPVISGYEKSARLVPESSIELLLDPEQELTLKVEYPRFVFAPVNKGETGGTIWVIIDGDTVGSCPLIYENDVPLYIPQEEKDSG